MIIAKNIGEWNLYIVINRCTMYPQRKPFQKLITGKETEQKEGSLVYRIMRQAQENAAEKRKNLTQEEIDSLFQEAVEVVRRTV